jgi:hypothetical protein
MEDRKGMCRSTVTSFRICCFLKGWLVSLLKKSIETRPLQALFPCVLVWEELVLNGKCRPFCAYHVRLGESLKTQLLIKVQKHYYGGSEPGRRGGGRRLCHTYFVRCKSHYLVIINSN